MSPVSEKPDGRTHPSPSDLEAGTQDGSAPGQTEDDVNPPLPFPKARCIAIVATTTGASFMNTFSVQSTVIILPSIARDLDIPSSRLQWVVSAYCLAFGCFQLLLGRIGDIYGKRMIFTAGTAWVAALSAANPFLPNEIAFDLFRGLYGLGAAANVPSAIGILGATFPRGKAKNYAFSTYGAGAPLGSVFGNVIAGFIAEYTSWKWVFGVMSIISAIIAAASTFVIPPSPPKPFAPPETTSRPSLASVDWLGGLLATSGLLSLLFPLTQGNVVGWKTPYIPALIIISFLLLTLFTLWQRHLETKTTRSPLVKISLFKSGKFSAALAIMALFFSSFNNFLVFATYFYQDYQGHSPLQTTLRFIPTGIAGALVALVIANLLGKVPTYAILLAGNASVSIACLLFAVPISPEMSYFAYGLPAMILAVVGADTTWPALTLFVSSCLSTEDQALGGALINSMGQIGRAIGLALATAVQMNVMAGERGVSVQDVGDVAVGEEASLVGIRTANWSLAALGLCSFTVVAFMFKGSEVVGRPRRREVTEEA